uniref:Uncharacterized protein n=1 Tax=Plectus sambesii TaxID=2011161 RepID=A0A914W484_9BILA
MTKEQLVIEIERLLKEPSEKPQFNVCDRLPCKNGGFCKPIGTSDYSCECPQNTTGVNCEKVLVCTLNTCPINAECSISNYQILCTCKHGYVKNQTECEPYDECEHRKPCQNGGKCISLQAAAAVDVTSKLYRCECPRHTTGENCEVVLQCTPTSCSNNANCFVDNHQINCVCKSGFATDDQGDCTVKIRQAHVWGEPHYTTFDGLQYDYQGTCPYTLTKPCNYDIDPKFSIRAQNKVYNFDKRVSVVTWVELTIYGHTFKVHENLTLIVDGTIVSVPYQLFIPGDDKWKVKADISSGQMRITTREHIGKF